MKVFLWIRYHSSDLNVKGGFPSQSVSYVQIDISDQSSALLALCYGNPLVTDGFSSQRTSNGEQCPWHDVTVTYQWSILGTIPLLRLATGVTSKMGITFTKARGTFSFNVSRAVSIWRIYSSARNSCRLEIGLKWLEIPTSYYWCTAHPLKYVRGCVVFCFHHILCSWWILMIYIFKLSRVATHTLRQTYRQLCDRPCRSQSSNSDGYGT